jgi:hypothetical protein
MVHNRLEYRKTNGFAFPKISSLDKFLHEVINKFHQKVIPLLVLR